MFRNSAAIYKELLCFFWNASQHQFCLLDKGKRKMGNGFGFCFYRLFLLQRAGTEDCNADRSIWLTGVGAGETTCRLALSVACAVNRYSSIYDVDEMVLNDPS